MAEELTLEETTQRGKRRAAFRFEILAMTIALGVLGSVMFGNLEAAILSTVTGFGATVFIASLGYAAALRGIDSYANEVVVNRGVAQTTYSQSTIVD